MQEKGQISDYALVILGTECNGKLYLLSTTGEQDKRLLPIQLIDKEIKTMAKTYAQLSTDQQLKAVEDEMRELLEQIIDGTIRFDDHMNGDNLQARIDTAIAEANRMQTPWFAHEYITDTCREDIADMAQACAEDTLYPTVGEIYAKGVF